MSGYLHVPFVCRLVDFGSAFRADQARLVSRKGTGTVAYSAPEVINGEVMFLHPKKYMRIIWLKVMIIWLEAIIIIWLPILSHAFLTPPTPSLLLPLAFMWKYTAMRPQGGHLGLGRAALHPALGLPPLRPGQQCR